MLEYGEVLNVPQADERDRKVERKEVPLFDEEAFREAIINAFVHNQWITGNAPMITVFSDRIEILSRGKMPPGQTIEGFFAGESVPVNQKLSDMFLQLHISERTGRGVPKITEVYGKETYEFRENSIVVSIPFTRVEVDMNTQDNTHDEIEMTYDMPGMTHDEMGMTYDNGAITCDNQPETNLNNIEERILEFCIIPRTNHEIMEFLGYRERKTVRRHIKPLIEQGRLAMTLPEVPKSKNQKYITIK